MFMEYLDAQVRAAYTLSGFMAENDMRRYYIFAFRAMMDITGTLVVPVILAVFLRYAYQDLPYEKLIFLISLAVVFVLSLIAVVKKVQRYGTEYKKLTDTQPASSRSGTGS